MKYFLLLILLLLTLPCSALAHDHKKTHEPVDQYSPPSKPIVIGQGDFRYQLVPGWATANAGQYKLGNCHAMAEDRRGRILLLNASKEHCLIALSPDGKVLDAWGTFAPGAHGLSVVKEGSREVLFIADNSRDGKVFKTTLDGKILMTVSCPMESGLYKSANEFKPSKTMHLPNGNFFIIDGYGKDYIHRYSSKGKYLSSFGGDIGKGNALLEHYGPHGGDIDFSDPEKPEIILALSDKNKLKRFTLAGKWLQTLSLPGSNPRDVIFHRDHIVIPHLGDKWPKDKNSAGYISVLNRDFKVVSNLGGDPPKYDNQGQLKNMQHSSHLFHHPHGICFDSKGALYVAQFASNATWPLKFVRLKN
ncbi:MAG: 6-bladed beta-propeller [Verrucomicrobia bacterium]|nr:6-bladed beta-propeller [Verrucomicrobiota bacterium]